MEYSIDLLIPPGTDSADFEAVIKEVIAEKWGANVPEFRNKYIKEGNKNIDKKTGEIRTGYEGNKYVTAKSQESDPPSVVDLMKQPLTGGAVVGGDIVNCFASVYPYDKAGNAGIGFQVVSVQLVEKADKPFGGGVSKKVANDAFDEYTDDDMVI